MAAKSDFAQKLLHDLRIRKERMAATQISSQNYGEMSRDMNTNSGRTSREAYEFNAPEHASSRKGNQRRSSNKTSSTISSIESPNQIVVHEKGENSRQVMDLSAAIAFAMETSAKLTKARSSGSNPLVNLFKRFGRRSMESQKTIITGYNDQSLSVQKLDQILKAACSNGINFDKNLVEVGRELLKGSIDLEESLRMLVNLQEASQYTNMPQQKSRIKLIEEEDKDDQEDKTSIKHVIKSKMVSHRRSASCIPDLSLSTEVKRGNSTPHSMPEKGRLSNVIVKLMGLDELPQLDDSTHKPQSSTLKGGKEKGLSKSQQLPHTYPKELEGGNGAVMHKKHHSIASNQVDVQISQVTKKRENVKGDRELHIIEARKRKKNVLNIEHSHDAQSRKVLKVRANTKHKGNLSTNYLEKRNANKILHQMKPEDQHVQIHENLENSETKQRAEHKGQQLHKQHFLINKQENRQRESIVSSTNKKKISRDKFTRTIGKSMNFTEVIPKRVPPNNIKQDIAPVVDTSKTVTTNEECIIEGDKIQTFTLKEPIFGKEEEDSGQLLTEDDPNPLSVNHKEVISGIPHTSENHQRIDIMMITSGIKEDQGDVTPTMCNVSEGRGETIKQSDNSPTEAENSISSCLEGECQRQNIPSTPTLDGNYHDNLPTLDQSHVFTDEQEFKQRNETNNCIHAEMLNMENSSGRGHVEVNELQNLPQQQYKKLPELGPYEVQLTEPEKDLEEILIQSQTFLNTAQTLFELNVPISFRHATDQNNEVAEKKLILDCGNELMKRKVRHDVTLHPYVTTTKQCSKIRSLDDLVKKLCEDFEILKSYGGNGRDESGVAERLQTIVSNDIYNNYPDVNSMWDFAWNKMMFEKQNVIRDVETYVLNGLLNDITHDLLLIPV